MRALLLELPATTLHRLLGWRPGSNSRFRHDRRRRLAHDVVIVDETSMVSLSLMARLIEALRDDARLVLVGDPGQLASIEAGAVLGDIVGPAGGRAGRDSAHRPRRPRGFGGGSSCSTAVHRFGGDIAALATAIRHGDADAVLDALRAGGDVSWIEADVAQETALEPVRDGALACAHAVMDAARAGDGTAGPGRAGRLSHPLRAPARALRGDELDGADGGLAGSRARRAVHRRALVRRAPAAGHRERLRARPEQRRHGRGHCRQGRVQAAFARGGAAVAVQPQPAGPFETVYAMTIHKSQGSQFDAAAVLLPDPGSRILTRELFYTAATRARRHLIIAGTEETIRAAVGRPVARASGLRARLWG